MRPPTILPNDCSLTEFFTTDGQPVLSGFEKVVPHDGRGAGSFVPFSMLQREIKIHSKRDLQAGVSTLGGALVAQAVDTSVVGFLRPKSVCGRLGATMRTGLKPNMRLPILKSDFKATWIGEIVSETPADVSSGQLLISPHRITIGVTAGKLLPTQSSPEFGAMLAEQATDKLMQALDFAALLGTGNAQPIGLFNTVGVHSMSFGAAATWAKILAFENAIGNANADGPNLGWAQSPDTRTEWKAAQRLAGLSIYLQDDFNRVASYPTAMTTSLNSTNANDRCVFGNWSDMVLGIFGDGVYVQKNPYTLAEQGEDQWHFTLFCDAGASRPQSFVVSTDSAAQ